MKTQTSNSHALRILSPMIRTAQREGWRRVVDALVQLMGRWTWRGER